MLIAHIAVLDGEPYIRPSILSALECCDRVVVVDAGSRDRTVEYVEKIVARDNRVLLSHSKEKNCYAQRQQALEITREKYPQAEWLLWLDADEVLSDDACLLRYWLDSPVAALSLKYLHFTYDYGHVQGEPSEHIWKIVRITDEIEWELSWKHEDQHIPLILQPYLLYDSCLVIIDASIVAQEAAHDAARVGDVGGGL